jgi:hypothetical protein
MNMTINEIAAEAAEECTRLTPCSFGMRPSDYLPIIKAAIEKATEHLEGALHHPDDPNHTCMFKTELNKLRAAHASEESLCGVRKSERESRDSACVGTAKARTPHQSRAAQENKSGVQSRIMVDGHAYMLVSDHYAEINELNERGWLE